MTDWIDSAEIVIIGGGVMGASAQFHLAEAGVTDTVLFESDQLACGSTAKSAGGVRLQFSDEINIALAQRSIEAFERFGTRPGADIELKQVGYLFLLRDPADVTRFEADVALQNSMGVPSRMVSPDEAKRLSPLISTDGVIAASFCPKDGHVSPENVVFGYAAAARALGARVVQQCPVTGVDVVDGEIRAVHTAKGSVRTSTVMCCAGAWSPQIGAMVGVDLPITAVRRPIWYTEAMPGRPDNIPLTIDFSTGFYFHGEGQGLLFGMADPDQPAGFEHELAADWLERTAEVAAERAPALLDVGIAGGWTGFYEVTPDHNAILGEAATPSRFFVASGFSGHGFQLGPAIGETLRDLYLGAQPETDISGFDLGRFARGELRHERNIV